MPSPLAERSDIPERSADQRHDALALANRIRAQRALLKAELKQGRVSIVVVLGDPPAYLATARIARLLMALPGYGPKKVERLLACCQVSPRKTVAGLSERQRDELLKALAQ
jgi:hypothetical protein